MNEDDKKSRKFWGNAIGLIDLVILIGMGVLVYILARVLIAFRVEFGPTIGSILTLIITIGPTYYIDHVLNEELGRRFPPFDKSGDSFQQMRAEINYNIEQEREKR